MAKCVVCNRETDCATSCICGHAVCNRCFVYDPDGIKEAMEKLHRAKTN